MHTIHFTLSLYTSTVTCAQLPAKGSELVHYNEGLKFLLHIFAGYPTGANTSPHGKENAYL